MYKDRKSSLNEVLINLNQYSCAIQLKYLAHGKYKKINKRKKICY